jgi:hypothetical protein
VPEALGYLLDHGARLLGDAEIGLDQVTGPAELLDFLRDFLRLGLVGRIVHRDLRALARQLHSDCPADPARGAGHQRRLAFDSSHPVPPFHWHGARVRAPSLR